MKKKNSTLAIRKIKTDRVFFFSFFFTMTNVWQIRYVIYESSLDQIDPCKDNDTQSFRYIQNGTLVSFLSD